jgi:hypothetical protein
MGGVWADYLEAGAFVSGGALVCPVADENANYLADVISPAQFAGDWWQRVVVLFAATGTHGSSTSLWWASLAADFYGLQLAQSGTDVLVTGGDYSGSVTISAHVTIAYGTPVEFVVTYRGSDSRVEIFANDVLLASGVCPESIPSLTNFAVVLVGDAGVTPTRVLEVEAAPGVYV